MTKMRRKTIMWLSAFALLCGIGVTAHVSMHRLNTYATAAYDVLRSDVVYDRTGNVLTVALNHDEQVCLFATAYPQHLTELVLEKEDQWFYAHPGIHPVRTLGAIANRILGRESGGASTVTQQLAKVLLGTTEQRSFRNKVHELMVAFALEYRRDKDDILTMYLNTVPLGGNIQGFPAAARAYFNKQVAELSESETLQLIAALSRPNTARPLSDTNLARATILAGALDALPPVDGSYKNESADSWLELADVLTQCDSCTATLDGDLTDRIRAILRTHLVRGKAYNMTHGAVAVIDAHTNELLALVGSPDPKSSAPGMRLNMAMQTRPIGSTIKPFLYLQGFTLGLRPYTLVDDREYKFDIANGFPLYPKNYDGQYRGIVTLEEALANSLNVPTVSTLRFIGLSRAYEYLTNTLGLIPPQPWEDYAYGIALGGLELDLLTLTHAFTALARNGTLAPLVVGYTQEHTPHTFLPPHSTAVEARNIAEPRFVALVNAILTDRTAGVEQFGVRGTLDLSQPGYAVKTGTTRDYHDSWTIGYTGDFVVGIWLGNVENTPMNQISGSAGAGSLWHDVMELMFTTTYHRHTALDTQQVVPVQNERGYSFGLPDDDVEHATTLLVESSLITSPHHGDTFLYTPDMRIPFVGAPDTHFTIDGEALSDIEAWYPLGPGTYTIRATVGEQTEEITVRVVDSTTAL